MMARMTINDACVGKRIYDPCCGSGRMLHAAADVSRNNEFYGQDIDIRCVQMTALNLALRNLNGWVFLGNSLSSERRMVLQTGFNGKGFIRPVDLTEAPQAARVIDEEPQSPDHTQFVLL